MKQTRKLLVAGAACALALGTAFAQDTTTTTTAGGTGVSSSTTSSTGTGVSASTTTSTLNGTGTLTAAPGSDYMMFRTESSTAPVRYYYSKSTTVVDPDGHTVAITALRPDMPVTYSYVKEGDRMVVSKITLTKPLSYYEKKETTTTTTTTP
jgi:hypothetical protein